MSGGGSSETFLEKAPYKCGLTITIMPQPSHVCISFALDTFFLIYPSPHPSLVRPYWPSVFPWQSPEVHPLQIYPGYSVRISLKYSAQTFVWMYFGIFSLWTFPEYFSPGKFPWDNIARKACCRLRLHSTAKSRLSLWGLVLVRYNMAPLQRSVQDLLL